MSLGMSLTGGLSLIVLTNFSWTDRDPRSIGTSLLAAIEAGRASVDRVGGLQ